MAVTTFPDSAGYDWNLISSTTPSGAASTVTFSSIPAYKNLRVIYSNLTSSGTALSLTLTFNGSTAGYSWSYFDTSTSTTQGRQSGNDTSIGILKPPSTVQAVAGDIIVQSTNLTIPKTIGTGSWGTTAKDIRGTWANSATVTSLTLTGNTTLLATGTIYLYGSN